MHFDDGSNPWLYSENFVQVFKFGSGGLSPLCGSTEIIIVFICYLLLHRVIIG